VNFPTPRDRKIAYVEFGDEEAMKAGLEKHDEVCPVHLRLLENTDCPILQKLGEGVPDVKRADNEPRNYGGFRGGRGRGFRGGGFAARGLSAAGLARGGAPRTNGDA
jgi:hypothetical protein